MKKTLVVFLIAATVMSLSAIGLASSNDIKADLRILWPGTSETEKMVAYRLQEKVQELYPGINIEYLFLSWADIEQKMAVMVYSGDYPDLMMIQDITNPVAMDALEPLDAYLTESINESQFIGAAWENMQLDGVTYGIPGLAIVYSHVYNSELFAELGIEMPFETWDDVIAASHALKANGKYGYAMANGGEGRFTFRDFMMVALSNGLVPNQVGEEYREKYIEVLTFFKEIASDMPEAQITWLYPELFRAWEVGNVGMMHTGTYFTPNLIDHGTKAMDRTEPFAFPAGPSADKPQLMVGAVGMSMFKGSRNKEAAWKVIETLMSPEMLGLWAGSINISAGTFVDSAVLEAVAKDVYPEVYKQHVELSDKWQKLASEYGVPMPKILGQPQMEKVVQLAVIKLLNGEITPEQAFDEIQAGITKIQSEF